MTATVIAAVAVIGVPVAFYLVLLWSYYLQRLFQSIGVV
jgi:hypothetical protein